jgi:MIP family channel proteins
VPDAAHAAASLTRRAVAEGVGTFVLVAGGTGAIVVDAETGGSLGPGGIAAAFGLSVLIMVLATGHISGAHINPAVTTAFALLGRLSRVDALAYVVAQLIGAVLASAGLLWAFGEGADLGVTRPALVGPGPAFGIELVLTAVLMLVIVSVVTDTRADNSMAAVAIGGTVGLEALVMGAATGASMNPARSLGPALVDGVLDDLWIYLTAPVLGAALGGVLYRRLSRDS